MILREKIAIVTGSASGIGRAIAEKFVQAGAQVAIADINLELAKKTTQNIGSAAMAVKVDVSDKASVEAMVDEVENKLGPIDIFVNNAGVSYITAFLECTEQLWDKTIRINLKGAFNGCQAAIRRMLPRKKGVILNMSSQSGKMGNAQYAAYCASKFGIIGLTQSLAVEFAKEGIRVNALCPGVVFTPLWDAMIGDYAKKRNMQPDQVKPYLENKIPMGRLCTAEDIANTTVFLASDDANYITGHTLAVDGGWLAF